MKYEIEYFQFNSLEVMNNPITFYFLSFSYLFVHTYMPEFSGSLSLVASTKHDKCYETYTQFFLP